MKNSMFCLYLNKSDIICQLFINIVFLFHYFLNEKALSLTGFSHSLVLQPNNILKFPIPDNRQKLRVQLVLPDQQLFNNTNFYRGKRLYSSCMKPNNQPNINHIFLQ